MNTLMATPPSKTTIGVMGSGSDMHEDLGQQIGRLFANLEVNLLTGAGGGVMTSVSEAYTSARRTRGVCIGIVPCTDKDHRETPKDGYPNRFVELPMYTHLPFSGKKGQDDLSRNHINILTSAAIVALPGGAGTASEIELAIKYRKPIVAFASNESLLANLHQDVKRVFNIDHVKTFLEDYIQ